MMMPHRLEGEQYLVVRTDAGSDIGAGHLMRCLALAQAWKVRGGDATFITCCESAQLRQRLANEGMKVMMLERPHPDPMDWQTTSEVLGASSHAWVVLDGYHFDPGYQSRVKQTGHQLLVVDDTAHLKHYYADIVLNQNINAELWQYSSEPYTRFLLGTRYTLLRSEFLSGVTAKREIPKIACKVLITLGGGDADKQTLKVIQALQQIDIDGFEAVVIISASSRHNAHLKLASHRSTVPIRLVQNVTNMAELMAWADLAVSGGGSTCWEMAFMGLPALVIILADNQRAIAKGLDEAGIVVNLGWHKDLATTDIAQALVSLAGAANERAEMSRRGRELIDGKGNDRVLTEFLGRCSN
jgi:UDP-2,4-diacetamido-2,4,6-trideoxy-beta-L-altropyranose hydrolase